MISLTKENMDGWGEMLRRPHNWDGITDALNRAFEGVKFPIGWDTDYYALVANATETAGSCSGCGGSGNITLQDKSIWNCPKCSGHGERLLQKTKYIVTIYNLCSVIIEESEATLIFVKKNTPIWDGYAIRVKSVDFATMKLSSQPFEESMYYIYNSKEEAQAEAKKLNAQGGNDE